MSTLTLAVSSAWQIRRVASIPSRWGIRMSMRTTSGRCVPGQRDRLGAVAGLADHLEVRLGVDDHPEAAAHERLVVGDQHADRHGPRSASGKRARTR